MNFPGLLTGLLCCVFFLNVQSQPLFSYGGKQVSSEAFKKAFSRNNSAQKADEKAYRDYLELYIRFKLKVQEAYEMKLDTTAGQLSELSNFRNQLAESYLTDQLSVERLTHEAFERSQKDIRLQHILVPVSASGGSDTSSAKNLAMQVYNELQKGMDFGKAAAVYSGDPSAKSNKGDLGFITVFSLPYRFENVAYSLPSGKISLPYRSALGYHIFKNAGERKAVGRIKVLQILFGFPPQADDAAKAAIKKKADSVYAALMKGASFLEMVKKYSTDNATYATGGEMPEFGVGRFDPDFESAAFSLREDGATSSPVLTTQGYHIIRRLQLIPVNTDSSNADELALVKQQVLNDSDRMEVSRMAMFRKIYQATGFKKAVINEQLLWQYTDSVMHNRPKLTGAITAGTSLFSLAGKMVHVGDWINYLKANPVEGRPVTYARLFTQFTNKLALAEYRGHLEEYNPGFKEQVNEFKEGNLLFEIMQRKIWNRAAADSAGLKSFYMAHKTNYWWQPGADAIIFTCNDSVTAQKLRNNLAQDITPWRSLAASLPNSVQADSGRFESSQLPVARNSPLTPGLLTTPLQNMPDRLFSVVYIVKAYAKKEPRTFEDAKGFVLNDYQSYLEDKWIAALKQKYSLHVNEAVLRSMWR